MVISSSGFLSLMKKWKLESSIREQRQLMWELPPNKYHCKWVTTRARRLAPLVHPVTLYVTYWNKYKTKLVLYKVSVFVQSRTILISRTITVSFQRGKGFQLGSQFTFSESKVWILLLMTLFGYTIKASKEYGGWTVKLNIWSNLCKSLETFS